jgi:pimeloyl-ACP methyl ester carboxylesterase
VIRNAFRGLSLLAPGLASVLARQVFLTPMRHQRPMRETWWATEAETSRLETTLLGRRRELALWTWGWGGPTVVLVHGWGGRGLQMGAFAEPLVEAGFRVVAFDAPGHGESSGSRTHLPEVAAAIDAVVRHVSDRENGGIAGIIAHSFGAAATTLAASDLADSVLGRRLPPVDRLVYVAPAVDLFRITEHFAFLSGFTPEVVGRMREGLERRFRMPWSRAQPRVLAGHMEQPLMVVHDRDDAEIPWTDARRLLGAWAGGTTRLLSTEGLGHFRVLRDGEVVRATSLFLAEAAPAPDPEMALPAVV